MQTPATAPVTDKQVVVLGASYAASWGSPALPGHVLINRGVAGQETSAMLARFDGDVVANKPDAVLIWGHINDIFRAPNGDMAAAVRKAKDNHRELIARAQAAGIEPILATEVTLSKHPGVLNALRALVGRLQGKQSYQERVNRHVREVNDFLRQQAAQHRLQLLDFERAFDDGEGFRKLEFSAEDLSHISPAGYEQLTAYTRSVWSRRKAAGK